MLCAIGPVLIIPLDLPGTRRVGHVLADGTVTDGFLVGLWAWPQQASDRGSRRCMAKRLYVGNLPFDTDEARLLAAFAQDGRKVLRVNVVMDRETNRQRGFAFVEMATEADAKLAIQAMNGADFGGRGLRVSEAEDRRPGAVPRSAAGAG
ncbi:MAG TPA: RNA-binding protein, partial [Planctomycetota bacterium]|nr:RNA-binding protein [Planctomycetota bacterium]